VGKIYFLLVRIKIKHMEIAIIKRETTGAGPNTYHENENIAKLVTTQTHSDFLRFSSVLRSRIQICIDFGPPDSDPGEQK
jgi:hypothetical protein